MVIPLFLLVPRLPRRVMDVQYLDCVITDAIENLIWIATERRYAHVGATCGAAHAFRPAGDMGNDDFQTPLDGTAESRIVLSQPNRDLAGVSRSAGSV